MTRSTRRNCAKNESAHFQPTTRRRRTKPWARGDVASKHGIFRTGIDGTGIPIGAARRRFWRVIRSVNQASSIIAGHIGPNDPPNSQIAQTALSQLDSTELYRSSSGIHPVRDCVPPIPSGISVAPNPSTVVTNARAIVAHR